jgi:serine/threonine protein kinase/WD40 repeat protein
MMSNEDALLDPLSPVLEEFVARYRRGERPVLTDYLARYPELAERIRVVFPMMMLMEEAGCSGSDSSVAASADTDRVVTQPQRIGGYRILREVGRGGMGVVYEAEQLTLGRHVALKVLPVQPAQDATRWERFQREAKAAARLHHTNIVPVFEVGADGAACFYAMQYIHGQPLDQVLDELRAARSTQTGKSSAASRSVADSLLAGSFESRYALAAPAAGAPAAVPPSWAILPGGGELSHTDSKRRPYHLSVAHIGIQVAEALAYAHQEGVIHRDIKPANLLLDTGGRVWVTDFGLAKTEAGALTQTGDIVGTVRYMAPERFRGWSDPRSDVYSLGLTLYEMLALRPAFPSPDRLRVIQQVECVEPPPLRRLDGYIPRDLETIVTKAIDKEPARRYQSAAELAADLQRFLEDKPILARHIGNLERTWRWCRRNPLLAFLATFSIVVVLAGFLGVYSQWQVALAHAAQAEHNEDEARTERNEARKLAAQLQAKDDELRSALYTARMRLARSAWDADNLEHLGDLLQLSQPRPGEKDLRGFEWHYWNRRRHAELQSVTLPLRGHFRESDGPHRPYALYLCGDGSRMVEDELDQGPLRCWDTATACVVATTPAAPVLSEMLVVLSRDGKRLARLGHYDAARNRGEPLRSYFQVWDLDTGQQLLPRLSAATPTHIHQPVFSKDGNSIAWQERHTTDGKTSWTLVRWDLARRRQVFAVPLQRTTPFAGALQFSADGKTLAMAAIETGAAPVRAGDRWPPQCIAILDGATGQERQRIAYSNLVMNLTVSPDGRRLATSQGALSLHRALRVWEMATGQERFVLEQGRIGAIFSPDGRYLAASGVTETSIRLWDAATGRLLHTFQGHTTPLQALAFAGDGRRLHSLSIDGTFKTWDLTALPGPTLLVSFAREVPTGAMSRAKCCLSPDGTRCTLAHLNPAHLVVHYDGAGQEQDRLKLDDDYGPRHVFLSPDARLMLTLKELPAPNGAANGLKPAQVTLWETATGKQRVQFPILVQSEWMPEPAWTQDGKHVVLCTRWTGTLATHPPQASEVKTFETATGREQASLALSLGGGELRTLALSADGALLAGSVPRAQLLAGSGRALVWDRHTGQLKLALAGAAGFADFLAFSPDGRYLACGGNRGGAGRRHSDVSVFDVSTGRKLFILKGLQDRLLKLSFVPGNRLLTVSQEHPRVAHQIKLWDARSGQELLTIERPGCLLDVCLTPEPRLIAVVETAEGIFREVLDARPLPPEVAARERLAELIRATPLQAEIIDRLQADTQLDEPVRQAALQLAAGLQDDVVSLQRASWSIVRRADGQAEDYQRALRCAEAAQQREPSNANHIRALGAAQYRVGRYAEALVTLRRSEKISAVKQPQSVPLDQAFLAMTCKQLGRLEEAQRYLELVRAQSKQFQAPPYGTGWALLAEAEALWQRPNP